MAGDLSRSGGSASCRGFRGYAGYLRAKYGAPAYRVAVDAGFGCPNRGPDRRRAGCLYCDERGALAPYQGAPAASRGA